MFYTSNSRYECIFCRFILPLNKTSSLFHLFLYFAEGEKVFEEVFVLLQFILENTFVVSQETYLTYLNKIFLSCFVITYLEFLLVLFGTASLQQKASNVDSYV